MARGSSKGQVNTQMPRGKTPSSKAGSAGEYGHGHAPFNAPAGRGPGDIQTKFYEGIPGSAAGRSATPGQTAGPNTRVPRGGTKQFPFGRNDT